MNPFAVGIIVVVVLPVLAVAGLIVFGTAEPPALLTSVSNPFIAMDYRGLPALERYQARDGARLSFRVYAAGRKQVAVLIHGSAGGSSSMHALALALQRDGITVYVPDLRGHGSNAPHGDIAYVGQLEDDLADLLARAKPTFPNAKWTLVGFSSGGGFALRVAAEVPMGQMFDRYILLSPYLRFDAPTLRTNATSVSELKSGKGSSPVPITAQSWAKGYTGRIIGLRILNRFGIHVFDGLPVVAFAVPPNMAFVTRTYSLRLQQNFGPHADYLADIRSASRPLRVYIGAADQLFIPEKMQEVFQSQRSDVPVIVLPGLDHVDMVTRPEAIEATVSVFQQ
ncbi:MAG: alpha/beta hydrolase [Dissulfurispiraceae bacterium]